MWQSSEWNGLEPALQNVILAAFALVFVHLPSRDWTEGRHICRGRPRTARTRAETLDRPGIRSAGGLRSPAVTSQSSRPPWSAGSADTGEADPGCPQPWRPTPAGPEARPTS